jgi:hypothetical protein
MPFGDDCKVVVASTTTAGAAGTSLITSAAVDTAGFRECTFIIPLGAIVGGAATSLKVQQCDTSGGSYADLLGSNQTIVDTEDDGVRYVTIVNPQEQFLKVLVSRATQNATIGGIIAILSGARRKPVTQPAGVNGEQFVFPAEGTA